MRLESENGNHNADEGKTRFPFFRRAPRTADKRPHKSFVLSKSQTLPEDWLRKTPLARALRFILEILLGLLKFYVLLFFALLLLMGIVLFEVTAYEFLLKLFQE